MQGDAKKRSCQTNNWLMVEGKVARFYCIVRAKVNDAKGCKKRNDVWGYGYLGRGKPVRKMLTNTTKITHNCINSRKRGSSYELFSRC